jgi:L-rhamnose mutarotase
MKSIALALDLKNDKKTIALYEKYHRDVWPEVLADLRANGIRRMEIFRIGNHLFMYCQAPDAFEPKRDFQKYTRSKKSVEWNELMMGFQQKVPEAAAGEWWSEMKRVFDTQWSK